MVFGNSLLCRSRSDLARMAEAKACNLGCVRDLLGKQSAPNVSIGEFFGFLRFCHFASPEISKRSGNPSRRQCWDRSKNWFSAVTASPTNEENSSLHDGHPLGAIPPRRRVVFVRQRAQKTVSEVNSSAGTTEILMGVTGGSYV